MKRTPLKRKTPLRPKARRWASKPTHDENRFCTCTRCLQKKFCDWHHILPRGRGGQDMPSNLIRLCRECHSWVHANPLKAEEAGLLRKWCVGDSQVEVAMQSIRNSLYSNTAQHVSRSAIQSMVDQKFPDIERIAELMPEPFDAA
jgi:hypothetical protein